MNRPRPSMVTVWAAVAVLGCSITAVAQPQLTVSPAAITNASTPLVFNNIPSGSISASTPVTVSTTTNAAATVIVQVNQNSPWLVVTPGASVNIPATLNVKCNTTGLTTGNYNGSFTITVDKAPQDSITVYVSLSVTGVTQLYAVPQSLSFTAQAGASAATPSGISVEILSSGVQLNYTLSAQTSNGGNWLGLSSTQGSTSGSSFIVSVNPAGLSATNYPAIFNGTITALSTTTPDAVQIAVQLTLNSTAQLSVTPTTPPPFLYQAGSATDPPVENLAISSAGGSLPFTIQENPVVSWLTLSSNIGTAGSTPVAVTLQATPREQGLSAGTYTTSLVVTPNGEPALAPIPVTLVVATHPLVVVPLNNLSFTASFEGSSPPAQSMTITGSGGANVGFTATSNVGWLTAYSSSSTTPATLTVQVNPTGLTAQNYSGTVTIAPTNGDPYTETIAVSLAVSGASQLVAGPQNLLFSYQPGQQQPQPQTIQITTTGDPITFSVSPNATDCGGTWLSSAYNSPFVNQTSNTALTVYVTPPAVSSGTCSGILALTYENGVGTQTLNIGVTLAMSSSAELAVNLPSGFGIASASQVSAPFQQQMVLTSTNPNVSVSYTASVSNVSGGGNWLSLVGPTNGTTPQYVDVEYLPEAATTAGTYTGTVSITSPTLASPFTVPVMLTVTSTTTVSVAPASLSFTEAQGGSLPSAQALTITSTPGNATYSAVVATSQGGNWLQISPNSGNTGSSIQVSVAANSLQAGTYQGQISLTFQGAATPSATVNVTLIVTASQTVTSSPSSLSFAYQVGGAAPASQQLNIASSGGAVAIGVAANSSGWLSADIKSGTTPQTINVSVNPAGLAANTYTGSISVSAPGVLSTPLSIPVTLTITSPPPPQPIIILNNASGAFGVISPGEEIAIKGANLGPSTPASGVLFSVNAGGGVSSTLAGVQVLFDTIPGTPIYVSANQIDVVVPYEINGRQSTTMTVVYNNIASAPFQLGVVPAQPGLFTLNSTGMGQVAAVNQNGSVNGAGSGEVPAPRGTVVSLYGTGGGQTTPISTTGSITPVPATSAGLLNIPNVTATVGGVPATVQFAGAAPGFVTGVFQVNIVVPTGIAAGSAVPVAVTIGNVTSPVGATLAVQ